MAFDVTRSPQRPFVPSSREFIEMAGGSRLWIRQPARRSVQASPKSDRGSREKSARKATLKAALANHFFQFRKGRINRADADLTGILGDSVEPAADEDH